MIGIKGLFVTLFSIDSPLFVHWRVLMCFGSRSPGWERTLYPSCRDGNPFVQHQLMGPDGKGHGRNWTVAQLGSRVTLWLVVQCQRWLLNGYWTVIVCDCHPNLLSELGELGGTVATDLLSWGMIGSQLTDRHVVFLANFSKELQGLKVFDCCRKAWPTRISQHMMLNDGWRTIGRHEEDAGKAGHYDSLIVTMNCSWISWMSLICFTSWANQLDWLVGDGRIGSICWFPSILENSGGDESVTGPPGWNKPIVLCQLPEPAVVNVPGTESLQGPCWGMAGRKQMTKTYKN